MSVGQELRHPDTSCRVEPEDFVVIADVWVGRVSDIICLETNGNFTEVSTINKKVILYKHSYACEARLPENVFVRANRSCLINLGWVKAIRRFDRHRLTFVMEGGNEVVMSRKETVKFKRMRSL
jgi:two-component system, LytTR family, response regulator